MIRDLFFVGILGTFFLLGLRRPFLFIPVFIYADLVRPQSLTYSALQPVPVSQILFFCALLGWVFSLHRQKFGWGTRQSLMVLLLLYCGISTLAADFPESALQKWDWVWKVVAFGLFLPLTLTTRLRVEAVLLITTLSVAANVIPSAAKTLLGGARYGSASMLVEGNSSIYESSTFACIAVATIPLIFCLLRQGTIFSPSRRLTRLYFGGLILACLLVPVGTEARTGLICVFMLGLMLLRFVRRPLLYIFCAPVLALISLPLLPASFMDRMSTITRPSGDSSASVRLAVWKWTLGYASEHPFGGGFNAYLGNSIRFDLALDARLDADDQSASGGGGTVSQQGRAFHSAYFEMLGEQGWPGLILWLTLHGAGLIRTEQLVRRHRQKGPKPDAWVATMAQGVQLAHILYLTGALFVGIAFNPFAFHLIGVEIALGRISRRVGGQSLHAGFGAPLAAR